MAKLNFKGKWVLITGASSGLGMEIARLLARREKANLIIAARRKDRLEMLKNELERETESLVCVLEADVASAEQADRLFYNAVAAAPEGVYAVINNAGVTHYGPAGAELLERFDQIIHVNLNAVMRLSLRFLEYFNSRGEGAILNVTSVGGCIPLPYQAVYSASKHGAQAFTEALAQENGKSGVVICACAPGGIATEMLTQSGLDAKHGLNSPANMKPSRAARLAVNGFKRKKRVIVPGLMNRVILMLVRIFPRRWTAAATEWIYRPPS